MFTLRATGPTLYDCTTPYAVELDKKYTVAKFIQTVLSNKKNEWGYIGIAEFRHGVRCQISIFGSPSCEYSYGEIISEPLPKNVLNKRVIAAKANGGYSRMDYLLDIE